MTMTTRTTVELDKLGPLLDGHDENPFALLGPHEVTTAGRRALAVRAYLPGTSQAWVVDPEHRRNQPMRQIHPAGFFEAICPLENKPTQHRYQLKTADTRGTERTMHDPYAFPPLLSEFDLYLLGEGKHWASYQKLGAQIREIDSIRGVNFAVWAPNATGVSVVGDFNDWDSRRHPMRKHVPSGIWELFMPGLEAGAIYKYHIRHRDQVLEKSDPYGFAAELPPRTASIVTDLSQYTWSDNEWMAGRHRNHALDAPMSVYEVHLGSWQRSTENPNGWLNYRDLAHRLVAYCKEMGYTHLELMPISEHPFTGSWGYQTVGYYSVTSRYGTPDDFMYFVDYCHQNSIGVLIDWVPAHFPRDAHGLRMFDGTHLYEHADPRQGEHPDWGTVIFNYGRNEVRNYLVSNALFWLDHYHIDGLRVDAVASMIYLDYSRGPGQWIPNEYGGRENLKAISFLKEFNEQTHSQYPGVLTIAEESTAWTGVSRPTYLGGMGFSLKWNMGWMNDTLRYMRHEPVHRKFHHDELTFSLIYAFSENFMLPFSHDEVVHGKGSLIDQMPGDLWQKFANLRLLYGYMFSHPGKKLMFMGCEFGQWNEWNYDTNLQWDLLQWDTHQGLKRFVADLNHLYRREPALHEVDFDPKGFEWVECHNWEQSTLAYLRRGKNPQDFIIAVCNFTPVPRTMHRIGVPELCWYEEVINSDSTFYGGSNLGNGPGIMAEELPWDGRPYSVPIVLPPLGMVMLKPRR